MIEVCANCLWISSCDDVGENPENEGCACFEPNEE